MCELNYLFLFLTTLVENEKSADTLLEMWYPTKVAF